jgi:hypothetical protein
MKGAVFYVKGSAFFMLSVITLVPLNVAKLLIYKMQKMLLLLSARKATDKATLVMLL